MSAEGPADQGLEALLEAGRQGAQEVDRGSFRLDWERALDKIKDFQLADPHAYVLELVQAAVAGDATAIEVSTDADDVVLSFDGQPYSEHDLQHLFDNLFAQGPQATRLRQMALGINAALALKPRFITVDSGDGQRGHRLLLTDLQQISITPLGPELALAGTRVHVRDRASWKVLSRAMRRESAEGALLAQRCPQLPVPLLLNGHDLRRPLAGQALARHEFDRAGVSGALQLLDPRGVQPELWLCLNGVRVEPLDHRALGKLGVTINGWIDDPALRRNASHSGVHRDEHYRAALRRLRAETRTLARRWLGEVLPLQAEDRAAAVAAQRYTPGQRRVLVQSMGLLLRARRKSALPDEVDALLDLPDVVQLAVKSPPRSALRPLWDAFRDSGQYHISDHLFDLALDDLPDGMHPATGPRELLTAIFGRGQPAEPLLEQLAAREYNRRQREGDPRPAVLTEPLLASISLEHDAPAMQGEYGLGVTDPARGKLQVTYLRRGVLLGQRQLKDKGLVGQAVLDCAEFEPNEAWEDVKANAAYRAVPGVLRPAVPRLLQALCAAFPSLPPSTALRKKERWGEAGGLGWDADPAATQARAWADRLLAGHPTRLEPQQAPWLYSWPLFFLVDGSAVSLEQLLAAREQEGGPEVRHLNCAAWGAGPPRLLLVNTTSEQRRVLDRYLPGHLAGGKRLLRRWRKDAAQRAERARLYQRNHGRAELRRQPPELHPRLYLAVVDLPLAQGSGQAGIPAGDAGSWVRFLVQQVPLPDHTLKRTPFAIHAVIQSPLIGANPTFEGVEATDEVQRATRLVRDAAPRLVAALAASPAGHTAAGAAVIWRYLSGLKQEAYHELPEELTRLPLIPTVAHGEISLQQVHADAAENRKQALITSARAGEQLAPRPVLRLTSARAGLLRRLLGVRTRDYTRTLVEEQDALRRMNQPALPAVLLESTLLKVELQGPQLAGELGFPADHADARQQQLATVRLLRQGVELQRRQLWLLGLPLTGVVNSDAFTPTELWRGVREDQVWEQVVAALEQAAERLALLACQRVSQLGQRDRERQALASQLQSLAGQRYRGLPELRPFSANPLDQALLQCPIWHNADPDQPPLSLLQLSEACRGPGRLWMVGDERGHLAPGRVMVRAAKEHTAAALKVIFGSAVRDGGKVLRRDDAAHRKRLAAPPLSRRLDRAAGLDPARLDYQDPQRGLSLIGEVAVPRDYGGAAAGQVSIRLALDGRLLCRHTMDHALRGLANVDCRGLQANRDWEGLADQRDLQLVERQVGDALWRSAQEAATQAMARSRVHREGGPANLLLLELLAALAHEPRDQQALLEALLNAPLFRAAQGQLMTGAQLKELAAQQGAVSVVADTLGPGMPEDGRLIVRAGELPLLALERLLGPALRRDDEAWAVELAGQVRRRTAPQTAPALSAQAFGAVRFRSGPTHGVVGLQRPDQDAAVLDRRADHPSRVRLHIDARRVATHSPSWHPAVEAWVNDDTLQPTLSFDDVRQDQALHRALELVQAQVPELVALVARQQARAWTARPDAPLRLRLCHLALASIPDDAAPDAAAALLLGAPVWVQLTAQGPCLVDTARLLAAHRQGRLGVVSPTVAVSAPDPELLLLRVTPQEREALTAALGQAPEDQAPRLRQAAARQAFLLQQPVQQVNLAAAGLGPGAVWRHRLDFPGWTGELGLLPEPGRQLEVALYWERRRLTTLELRSPVRAACAVQCGLLTVNQDFTGVARDEALAAWQTSIAAEVTAAVTDLARAFGDCTAARRAELRPVLLRALLRASDSRAGQPELADVLRLTPLLRQAGGELVSLEQAMNGEPEELAVVAPATARQGPADAGRLVLVLSAEESSLLQQLVPVRPFDAAYRAAVLARQRREQAPRRADVSWFRAVARDAVASASLSGELALKLPRLPGSVTLMSGGRVVEQRSLPACPGLVGWVNGELPTDAAFGAVELSAELEAELEQLYLERLERAVALAASWRPWSMGRWPRLVRYALIYLERALAAAGLGGESLRQRLAAGDLAGIAPPLAQALALPLVRLNSGGWVDLATATAGEQPLMVLCPSRIKRGPPADGATLVVDDPQGLEPVLARLVGRRAVTSHERWLRRQHRRQRERQRKAGSARELAAKRALDGLRSVLRAVQVRLPNGPLRLKLINKIRAAQLEPKLLTRVGFKAGRVKQLQVNLQHRLWQAAAGQAGAATAHLAATVVSCWADAEHGWLDEEQAVELLTALAVVSCGDEHAK